MTEETYRKLPPMLNWKEREAGLPGQPPLHALRDEPSRAEKLFLSLSEDWRKGFSSAETDTCIFIDDETEKTLLTCLLLAHKLGSSFTEVAYEEIEENISMAERWRCDWIYTLPWQLAMASRLKTPCHSHAIESLAANLNHQNSSIRMWLLQVAWFIRRWMNPETTLDPLLKNVAMSNFGDAQSWVIAATLFQSEDEFFKAVDSWKFPEDAGDLESIYVECLKKFRKSLNHLGDAGLWELEAKCWQAIAERSLSDALREGKP